MIDRSPTKYVPVIAALSTANLADPHIDDGIAAISPIAGADSNQSGHIATI